jgi:hypothetical protein
MRTIFKRAGIALLLVLVIVTAVWAAIPETQLKYWVPTLAKWYPYKQGQAGRHYIVVPMLTIANADSAAVKPIGAIGHKIYVSNIYIWCKTHWHVASAGTSKLKVCYITPTRSETKINAATNGDEIQDMTEKTVTALTLTAANRTVPATAGLYYTYTTSAQAISNGTGYALTIEYYEVP